MISKIGGAVQRNYYNFRQDILYLNDYIIPLFVLLGFDLTQKEKIIDILLAPNPFSAIRRAYFEKEVEGYRNGKLKIESLLSRTTLAMRDETVDEREKRIDKEIIRNLKKKYGKIYNKYIEIYKTDSLNYNKYGLEILRDSLILDNKGFSIDVDKYIKIYSDYLEANGSTTFEEHKAVADAINHFFGGAVEITIKELERYFKVENGIVIPNPKSINQNAYIRLGYKGKCRIIKK